MGLLSALAGPLLGEKVGGALQNFEGAKAQEDINKSNIALSREQMGYNSAEAAKNRDFQAQQRSTQYQTAVQDMQAAGLNPMLAYTQGGAGTSSGATASYSSLPQQQNKETAAMTNSAMQAQINNMEAQTVKTMADTEVSKALAKKTEAEIGYTTTSTANVQQTTQNLKEQIDEIRSRITLAQRHASESQSRTFLLNSQQALTETENRLTAGKISLTDAQTTATRIGAQLSKLELPGAENTSKSDTTWYGRNVRPYLKDVGSITNSAVKSRYLLKD